MTTPVSITKPTGTPEGLYHSLICHSNADCLIFNGSPRFLGEHMRHQTPTQPRVGCSHHVHIYALYLILKLTRCFLRASSVKAGRCGAPGLPKRVPKHRGKAWQRNCSRRNFRGWHFLRFESAQTPEKCFYVEFSGIPKQTKERGGFPALCLPQGGMAVSRTPCRVGDTARRRPSQVRDLSVPPSAKRGYVLNRCAAFRSRAAARLRKLQKARFYHV